MASVKSGAISSSRNPAIPQPIRVTRNVSRLCSLAKRMNASKKTLYYHTSLANDCQSFTDFYTHIQLHLLYVEKQPLRIF